MLNTDHSPKIIISASGMCEAGRIRHHLKHNIWDSRNSIVFVGYQAEGTLGRFIVEGAKEVKLFGETIMVGAEIYDLEGFSGHADQAGLLDWLSGFTQAPKQIFLVHGEEESKNEFARKVKEDFGYDTVVIHSNSEFELETGELLSHDEVVHDAIDEDTVAELMTKLDDIRVDISSITRSTKGVIGGNISSKKLTEINNIVQELEKACVNLGSSITEEDREPSDQAPEAEGAN